MAAISLIATAISTYYGAAVARDQLDQSQGDAEKADRVQASRVAFWVEADTLVIANRSLDPIHVYGIFFDANYGDKNGVQHQATYDLNLDIMPPCTRYTIASTDLNHNKTEHLPKNTQIRPWWIRFLDNNDMGWARDNLGAFVNLDDPVEDRPDNFTKFFLGLPLTDEWEHRVVQAPQKDLHLHPAPLKDCTLNK